MQTVGNHEKAKKNTREGLRLVLGTAQLGMHYGIANKTGQPDMTVARSMITTAWENGIKEFDTAQAYGVSESVLGRVLQDIGIATEARIISKPHPDVDHLDEDAMRGSVKKSLRAFGLKSIFGWMMHRERSLEIWDRGVGRILNKLVNEGLVKQVGVSVYSPAMAVKALKTEGISFIQVPTNILDGRFAHAGVFDMASALNKTVYIRSVFLQGLLLLEKEMVPPAMKFALPAIEQLDQLAFDLGMHKRDLALGYVRHHFPDAKVVLGAELPAQIEENLISWDRTTYLDFSHINMTIFGEIGEEVLNPSLWPEAVSC